MDVILDSDFVALFLRAFFSSRFAFFVVDFGHSTYIQHFSCLSTCIVMLLNLFLPSNMINSSEPSVMHLKSSRSWLSPSGRPVLLLI